MEAGMSTYCDGEDKSATYTTIDNKYYRSPCVPVVGRMETG